jgi:hypothetical protein
MQSHPEFTLDKMPRAANTCCGTVELAFAWRGLKMTQVNSLDASISKVAFTALEHQDTSSYRVVF